MENNSKKSLDLLFIISSQIYQIIILYIIDNQKIKTL